MRGRRVVVYARDPCGQDMDLCATFQAARRLGSGVFPPGRYQELPKME